MKKLALLSLTLVLLFTLAACGGGQQPAQTGTNDPSGNEPQAEQNTELKEIEVMLDWYPNAVHAYLYQAIEEGYFEEEGLDVRILFPANPTDPINLAASGKIALGITYQPDVIMARAKDIPIVSIATIVRSPLNYPMLMADSEIQSPVDFEGKDVGYPGIPLNEPIIKTMVETDGGDFSKVNMIDVGFELGASIVSGRIDAVVGTFINHEFSVLEHQGHEVRYFDPVEYGVPSYSELVFVTSEQTLKEQREEIEAFWRAAQKGYERMKQDPEKSLDILFANQDQANFPLIREVEEQSLEILLPKMEAEGEAFGSQYLDAWQEVIDWLLEAELIDQAPNAEEIFVNLVE